MALLSEFVLVLINFPRLFIKRNSPASSHVRPPFRQRWNANFHPDALSSTATLKKTYLWVPECLFKLLTAYSTLESQMAWLFRGNTTCARDIWKNKLFQERHKSHTHIRTHKAGSQCWNWLWVIGSVGQLGNQTDLMMSHAPQQDTIICRHADWCQQGAF